MDSMMKQLDALMGANRNDGAANLKYSDHDVCRYFLVGLCPYDLQLSKKDNMIPCKKVHSLQLRKEYQVAKGQGIVNYNSELVDRIKQIIEDCDRKIQKALKPLEDERKKAAVAISVSKVTQSPEIQKLSKEIKEKLKEIDALDLEGKTDDKIRASEVVQELKDKRAQLQSELLSDSYTKDRASLPNKAVPDASTQEKINQMHHKAADLGEQGMAEDSLEEYNKAEILLANWQKQRVLDGSKFSGNVLLTDQTLRVCDICGGFLNVNDNVLRLTAHFRGKIHSGYMLLREKLADLQEEGNQSRKVIDERRSKESSRRDDRRDSSREQTRLKENDGSARGYGRGHGYARHKEVDDSRKIDDSRNRPTSRSRGFNDHSSRDQDRPKENRGSSRVHDRHDDREHSSREQDRLKEIRGSGRRYDRHDGRRHSSRKENPGSSREYGRGHGHARDREGDDSREFDDSRNDRRSRSPRREHSRRYNGHRDQDRFKENRGSSREYGRGHGYARDREGDGSRKFDDSRNRHRSRSPRREDSRWNNGRSSRDEDRLKENRGSSPEYGRGHGYARNREGDDSRKFDGSRNRHRSRSPRREEFRWNNGRRGHDRHYRH